MRNSATCRSSDWIARILPVSLAAAMPVSPIAETSSCSVRSCRICASNCACDIPCAARADW
ncbi:MAG: hypothetical protein AW07_04335 [Candidatus Accumulibacter sp. SK-11]|nr:MAG: hypothetical protein AW07_04335 [Candidatus Accumulibacter sp. SK-11]